jgi:hypothetical protein
MLGKKLSCNVETIASTDIDRVSVSIYFVIFGQVETERSWWYLCYEVVN